MSSSSPGPPLPVQSPPPPPPHGLMFCTGRHSVSLPSSRQFQAFSQYRCKTAKKSEEEIDFLRSNPKIWNVHSVLNVLHSLVDKSNINRQLEVYTSGGECCLPSVPGEERPQRGRCSLGNRLLPFGVGRGQ